MRLVLAACLGMLATTTVLAQGVPAGRESLCLAVVAGEPPGRAVCLPVRPGELFELEFINSIYGAPVRETFKYEPGRGIVLVRVESPSPGVFEYYGLTPEGGGNGSGSASVRRVIGEITLRSHDYEHHVIRLGGKSIRLKGLVADGAAAMIRVETAEGKRP
jgi:hypothetical protein